MSDIEEIKRRMRDLLDKRRAANRAYDQEDAVMRRRLERKAGNINSDVVYLPSTTQKIGSMTRGCCPSCEGLGVGGPASDMSTNGKCSDCYGTGHLHNADVLCPSESVTQ